MWSSFGDSIASGDRGRFLEGLLGLLPGRQSGVWGLGFGFGFRVSGWGCAEDTRNAGIRISNNGASAGFGKRAGFVLSSSPLVRTLYCRKASRRFLISNPPKVASLVLINPAPLQQMVFPKLRNSLCTLCNPHIRNPEPPEALNPKPQKGTQVGACETCVSILRGSEVGRWTSVGFRVERFRVEG